MPTNPNFTLVTVRSLPLVKYESLMNYLQHKINENKYNLAIYL